MISLVRPAAAILLLPVVALVACHFPAPSCDESTELRTVKIPTAFADPTGNFQKNDDGSFTVSDRFFRSCTELCDELSGVTRTISCKAPFQTSAASSWSIECNVEAISCREPFVGPKAQLIGSH